MHIYLAAVFLVGFSGIIFQVQYLREFLTIFYGNELCIGSILALWLLGVACGALAGFAVPEKRAALFFRSSCILLHLLFPLLMSLLRMSITPFIPGHGEYIPFYSLIAMAAIFMVPASFQIGFTFPLACSVIRSETSAGVSIGKVYISEGLGALTGGVVFTFLLAGRVSFVHIALIQIILASLIILFTTTLNQRLKQGVSISLIIAGVLCAVSPYPSLLNRFTLQQRWNAFFAPLPLNSVSDTRYQHVSISKQNGQTDIYSNLKYRSSIPDPYTNELYAHFTLAQHHNPQDILIVQGVFDNMIPPLIAHKVQHIDIIEFDKSFYETVLPHVPQSVSDQYKRPEVRLVFQDGRFFVQHSADKRYDVIFINVPDPDTALLNRYYTRNFFIAARDILKPDGILAMRLTSAENYFGESVLQFNAVIYKTLTDVFPDVLVTPSEQKIFLAAQNTGILTTNPVLLIDRFNTHHIMDDRFQPEIFIPFLDKARTEFTKETFASRLNNLPLNTDHAPVAYHYALSLWDEFSGSRLKPLIRLVEKIDVPTIITMVLCICMTLIIALVICFKRNKLTAGRRITLFWVIFSTGFTAMGVEILLLFTFQNVMGYLYSMVGFIVALFMFGLTAGACTATRYIRNSKTIARSMRLLLVIECIIPVTAFLTPLLLTWMSSTDTVMITIPVFLLFVALSGFLTGVEFPIAANLFSNRKQDISVSSGILDSADHLGAFTGALFAGTFLIPLLGITATSVMIGLLNVTSCVTVCVYALFTQRSR